MSELLFEAYSVPAVAYGVDALFSAYHSYAKKGNPLCDALIVSSGHQATHILPVLDGKFDARHCKRLTICILIRAHGPLAPDIHPLPPTGLMLVVCTQ